MTTKKVNYLNNKDILKEIHHSKMSYCFVADQRYIQYDIILNDINEINSDTMQQAKQNKAARIQSERYAGATLNYNGKQQREKPKQKDFVVDIDSIADEDVVFRVMTFVHVTCEPDRKKTPKSEADTKAKVNFPPFKHYAYCNGELTEVVRSHWRGDLINGEFDTTHGRITDKLGIMFLKLVERYSHRANWRNYSYVDEMRGQALVQLSQIGLQFNEAKSDNPFAYYTAAVNNSFTRILNLEKRNQTLRDEILIGNGHMPSFSRQIAHEHEMQKLRETATVNDSASQSIDGYQE